MSGNPVRRELVEAAETGKEEGPPTLLVLGGSQGAHRVNELVVGAVDKLFKQLPSDLTIFHQTGEADEVMVRDAYGRLGIKAEVAAFFHDMRAGAASGRPGHIKGRRHISGGADGDGQGGNLDSLSLCCR